MVCDLSRVLICVTWCPRRHHLSMLRAHPAGLGEAEALGGRVPTGCASQLPLHQNPAAMSYHALCMLIPCQLTVQHVYGEPSLRNSHSN